VATKLASLSQIGATAIHSVYVEAREGRLLDDVGVIVQCHSITPPGLPRADRWQSRDGAPWGWGSAALFFGAIVPWGIGLGWVAMQLLMAIKGWLA
jgi:hypothetical protein